MTSHSLGFASLLILTLCRCAAAQELIDRPALDELSRQTQSLYHQASLGVVRVQLATTRPSNEADPMARWNDKLGPDIRARLLLGLVPGVAYVAEVMPGTQPTVQVRRVPVLASVAISPNAVGMIVDDKGDAIVPMFAAKPQAANALFPVLLGDGSIAQARFVGSDSKSNITVVRVLRGGLRPLALGGGQPPDGSLVLVMSVDPTATHLGVWTRWANNWGGSNRFSTLIMRTDGAVAGFCGNRPYLSAASCIPVARQLIQYGRVWRPWLGVSIQTVLPDDPRRQLDPVLGQTPAIRILHVLGNSPAERAKLQPGDLILSLGGQPVGDSESFATAIAALNGPAALEILRGDQRQLLNVDVQPAPGN